MATQHPASWTARAMSRRLDIQAWTHREQTNPEANHVSAERSERSEHASCQLPN